MSKKLSSKILPRIDKNDNIIINILLLIFIIVIIYLTLTNPTSKNIIKKTVGKYFIDSETTQPITNSDYIDPRVLGIEGFANPDDDKKDKTESKDKNDDDKKETKLEKDKNGIPTVHFPFKNLFDQNGNKINIILLAAPFRGPDHDKIYKELKTQTPKLEFMGISSYCEFPGKLTNPFEGRYHEEQKHIYESMVSTWLNCFRNPSLYINPAYNLPILDFSESDLRDDIANKPDPSIKKEYDFIYICLNDNDKCTPGWQSYNRNWELAQKCLNIMCGKFKLKGAIIGRENCQITDLCSGIVKIHPFLKYHEFQKELQKAKFLFVPNIADASPRVITESLCYDMRLLVNYNILGGWKYVKPETGEFFHDEKDLEPAIQKLMANMDKYQPRKHFTENYGKVNAGKKLAKFIKTHYPNVVPQADKIEYATITI
jgi:hypothetical protein